MTKPTEKICQLDSCGVVFTPTGRGSHLRRYCDEHSTSQAASAKGNCDLCGKQIPLTRARLARYCTAGCREAASLERKKERDRQGVRLAGLDPAQFKAEMARHGEWYHELKRQPELVRQVLSGQMPQAEVARQLGTSEANISRALAAIRIEIEMDSENADWMILPKYQAMLALETLDRLIEIGPGHDDVEGLVAEASAAFWLFEAAFFTVGSKQLPFIVKPYHEEIILGMIRAFAFGSRLLVLTPPRHGKSELMIRFVAWLIIMYPNIQILWVAANKDLAGQMTGKLKGTFEYNVEMREAFLPPGKKYGDKGCTNWSKAEFTLYTRTDHTLKSPTFTGLGSTSTVAGRDCDFIGVDDLEERKTVATPELRQKSRTKHAEIMERQEEHTGVATIASRQHPDDIPNHLMDMDGDDTWDILVYPAHDDISCEADPEKYEDHVDCMLMPEVRSYKWLMAMENEAIALGLPGRFPLRYQQEPVPEDGIVFDIPLIKEKCLDRSRGLGMGELPPMRLVGGLDPAARGTQVAFLWGWDGTTLHMIDFIEDIGGGVMKAVDVMRLWDDAYDLKLWFHEDNSGQIDAWRHVPEYRSVQSERGIIIKSHTTGMNKHDPESGVSSMAIWYHRGSISLPYGSAAARRKTKRLLTQLQNWTSDGFSKRGKTDIKMAHWLPFPTVAKWIQKDRKVSLRLSEEASYPGLASMNEIGWQTPYPGR